MGDEKTPPPMEYALHSPYRETRTLAVAPTINLSGSNAFDPLAVSDKLFEEMQQVAGLNMLPLNKTLMVMRRLGIHTIDEPIEAQKIAEALGADGLIVPAVTAYDPYNPPMVGMTLQMYTPRRVAGGQGGAGGTGGAVVSERQPVSQANAIFNATNQSVLRELRDYSAGRTQYDSALQDQRYLADSDLYMRFVCHAMARRLMEVERVRVTDR